MHSGKLDAIGGNGGNTFTLSSSHYAIMQKDSDEPYVEGIEGK